jgi:hypothetical protein
MSKEINWGSQIEKVIADEGEKALSWAFLHQHAQKNYNRLDIWINIPIIVLSTLTGTASVGSESLFNGNEIAPVIIGLVSLLVGVLNTLSSYFGWAKRTEGHRLCGIQYEKYHNFIRIELSLPRYERMPPSEFLKIIKEGFERLAETAPQIPDSVIAMYRMRFENNHELSKPTIANGMDKIEIYSEIKEMASRRESTVIMDTVEPVTVDVELPVVKTQNKKPVWK